MNRTNDCRARGKHVDDGAFGESEHVFRRSKAKHGCDSSKSLFYRCLILSSRKPELPPHSFLIVLWQHMGGVCPQSFEGGRSDFGNGVQKRSVEGDAFLRFFSEVLRHQIFKCNEFPIGNEDCSEVRIGGLIEADVQQLYPLLSAGQPLEDQGK